MSILRIVAALCCCLFLSSAPSNAQDAAIRHPTGAFTVPVPPGWKLIDNPGLKYKMGYSPSPLDGFIPNVAITEETFSGSLAEYVASSIQGMEEESRKGEILTDFHFVKQAEVTSKSGVKMIRVIYLATGVAKKISMRNQVYAVAGKGDIKYIITYSFPESAEIKFDTIIIKAMSGLKVD